MNISSYCYLHTTKIRIILQHMNDKMTHPFITPALAPIPINLLAKQNKVTSCNLFEQKFTLHYYFMI
jgi:hypothetical protein